MAMHYSDPKRASDPHALPDVEVWESRIVNVECRCGDYETHDGNSFEEILCPSCERKPISAGFVTTPLGAVKYGWFYWFCFPGCLPDGEPMGPFATEADALADAQKGATNDE